MKQILDMVLHAPLYEADGDLFLSRDAFGHPCTVSGALWRPAGREFSGANSRINCGSAEALDNLGTAGNCHFSIGAWIKPNNKGQSFGRVFDKTKFYLYCDASGQMGFEGIFAAGYKNVIAPANSAPYGSWSYVAGVYNGANMLMYINNALTVGAAVTGALVNHSAYEFSIGNRVENDRCFDGIIGEVMAYNRALTPQEIKRNYLAAKWRYQ